MRCRQSLLSHWQRSTYRPASKTLDAMGLISELICRKPSYGLSSRGLTIVAVTCASTLKHQLEFLALYARGLPQTALDGTELGAKRERERALFERQPPVQPLALGQRRDKKLLLYCRGLDFARHRVDGVQSMWC